MPKSSLCVLRSHTPSRFSGGNSPQLRSIQPDPAPNTLTASIETFASSGVASTVAVWRRWRRWWRRQLARRRSPNCTAHVCSPGARLQCIVLLPAASPAALRSLGGSTCPGCTGRRRSPIHPPQPRASLSTPQPRAWIKNNGSLQGPLQQIVSAHPCAAACFTQYPGGGRCARTCSAAAV